MADALAAIAGATVDADKSTTAASFAERMRNRVQVCPACYGEMSTSCRFSYNEYQCWTCGVTIDSRAGQPLSMDRAEAKAKHDAWEAGEDV